MITADDYVQLEDGRWVRRDKLEQCSKVSPDMTGGRLEPQLIWAKNVELEANEDKQKLLGNFIWRSSSHLFSGVTGEGKTTVLMNVAIQGCKGEDFAGIPFSGPVRCLYVDSETPSALRATKLHRISRGQPPDGLAFVPSIDLERDLSWLIQTAKENSFNLLIIDTINEAFDTVDEDSNAEANRQMAIVRQLIRETGAAAILVHHIGKAEGGKKVYRSRGASARAASADVVLNLEGVGDDVVRLEVVKNRWLGGTSKLFLRKVGDDLFEPTELCGEESTTARIKAQDVVFEMLERSGVSLSTGAIITNAKAEGFAPATIERALASLVEAGKVNKPKRGQYQLTESVSEASITSPLGSDVIDGKNGNEWVTERI